MSVLNMTAVIMAGGQSRRMGKNKALLPFDSKTVIEIVTEKLARVFDGVVISAADGKEYERFGLPVICDETPGLGVLGGIYSALRASATEYNFFVACDMPLIRPPLIEFLAGLCEGHDVVVPETEHGLEPLHAFYSKACIEPIQKQLEAGDLKIISFFPEVRVRIVEWQELEHLDPDAHSLWNINTWEDYQRLKEEFAH